MAEAHYDMDIKFKSDGNKGYHLWLYDEEESGMIMEVTNTHIGCRLTKDSVRMLSKGAVVVDNRLFQSFPILETERLILRQITENDQDILFKYWSDDIVTRYMNISTFKDKCEVLEMVQLLNNLYKEKKAIRWGIHSKEFNCIVGTCGYNSGVEEEQFIGEVGYELGREYWGKRYMPEALRAILYYGFNSLRLNRVEAYVMVDNHQSVNLLNKLGFHKEGLLREHGFYKDKFWDEYIFSLLNKDFIK